MNLASWFHWLHEVVRVTWIPILAADWILRSKDPWRRRMMRGAYSRWERRTFGFFGATMVLIPYVLFALPVYYALGWEWPVDLFYLYLLVALLIDWFTGGDDPPWRKARRGASWLVERLRIAPPPRPAIDV